jgi:trimeric autotransporter adhesin
MRTIVRAFVLAWSLASISPAASNGFWDARFFPPGCAETVYGLATFGSNVIAAGVFSTAGDVVAKGAARWGGARWNALGGGLDQLSGVEFAWAAATDGQSVWLGGTFASVGGQPIRGLAQWNGSEWSSVGGFGGQAGGLLYTNGDLYVAGNFSLPGDTNTYAVGRWTGSAWETFGSVTTPCNATCWTGNRAVLPTPWGLLAGNFFGINSAHTNAFALWNGTHWQSVPGAPTQFPQAFATDGTNVYAACNGAVYSWDGTNWIQIGSASAWINSVVWAGGKLWAGGAFNEMSGVPALKVAVWDGVTWSQPGAGFRSVDNVLSLAVAGEETVIAGGALWWSGTNAVSSIAQFRDGAWHPMVSTTPLGLTPQFGLAYTMAEDGTNFWVGGTFFTAGTSTNAKLAAWTGTNWSFLPNSAFQPFAAQVRAIAVTNGAFYITGRFTDISGSAVSHIASWTGTNWQTLSTGLDFYGDALAMLGSNLFVGGRFTNAGGLLVNRVARWDGHAFHALNDGFDAGVLALTEFGGELIAGGSFTKSGDTILRGLAKWNGASWSGLGAGLDGEVARVNRLLVHGGKLYVGGRFDMAAAVPSTNVAVWDGTNWMSLGGGVIGSAVNGIAIYNGAVFVTGQLTNAAGERSALLRWDGTNWNELPARLATDLYPHRVAGLTLASWRDGLYVSGRFERAGNVPMSCFGRWTETPPRLSVLRDGGEIQIRAEQVRGARFAIERAERLSEWRADPTHVSYENEAAISMPISGETGYFRVRVAQ